MDAIEIQPAPGPVDAVVQLPGSKSLTNRALLLASLASGRSTLTGALFSEDTSVMLDCLRRLGIRVSADERAAQITVEGCAGQVPEGEADLSCGNSGTTIRFCTALCALAKGRYRLDGIERMRARPIGHLVDALRALGAEVDYEAEDGFPPLLVEGHGLRGGELQMLRPPSSQYVSALLMVAPYALDDVYLRVRDLLSAPYVAMTCRLMERFGVGVLSNDVEAEARYVIPAAQTYQAQRYAIEPDASNASYFLAAAAITGGRVTVTGLGSDSLQGDVGLGEILARMGAEVASTADTITVSGPPGRLRGIDVDLNAMPDMAQTVAVVAVHAEGPTRIRNVANLRLKETDRIAAVATELRRLGAEVEALDDGLRIEPPSRLAPAAIETYDDHRMAMSFSLAGLRCPGVVILDPGCVRKTFPDFFARFAAMTHPEAS